MKRKVHLYGALKRQFGSVFEFDIATAGEAFRAFNCAFPRKFADAIKDGSYHVIRGRRHGGMSLDLDLITNFNLGNADLHIVPAAKGASSAKRGGTLKAVAGIAILGAAVFFSGGTLAAPLANMGAYVPGAIGSMGVTWGNIAAVGLGLTLMGAAQALAKAPSPNGTDYSQSFMFNGPVNTNEQGNPIPLVIGEVITGSQPISAYFDIEDSSAYKTANQQIADLLHLILPGGSA